MNSFFRGVLFFIAFFAVGALGYSAYSLMSRTLVFPFTGVEKQYGSSLEVLVSPPRLSGHRTDPLWDETALRSSLMRGDIPLSPETVSGEYSISSSSGGYLRIDPRDPKKGQSILTLDADLYNQNKKTPYSLPRDIMLVPSDTPASIDISGTREPREQLYNVEMYGIPDTTPRDIRYYVHYDPTADCTRESWGEPRRRMSTPSSKEGSIWTPSSSLEWIYTELTPEIIEERQDGQKSLATIKLPYNRDSSRVCIIAGAGGYYRTIEDRLLEPFSVTGSISSPLSPIHDMQTQISTEFSEDIYSDSGTLYSPEYIDHRSAMKQAFLKKISISPSIPLTEKNLVLSPDRAVLSLPLDISRNYEIDIRDIEDIYGRQASLTLPLRIESERFLGMTFPEKKNIYTTKDPLLAKLYTLEPLKKSYPLTLCSVSLDQYARLERILTNQSRAKNTMTTEILKNAKNCQTRDITLSNTGGYTTNFSLDTFFQGEKKPGLYVLSFSEEDILSYGTVSGEVMSVGRFLPPLIFAIVDTHITMKVDPSGKMMFLATDIMTGEPRPDQSITLARNISRTHTEKWNPTKQVVEKEYIPLSSQGFASGVSIGRTDRGGYIDTRVDTLKGIEGYDSSPYSLAFSSWWDYEGRYDSFIAESRSDGHLGYLVSTWNDGITGYNFGIKDSDYSYQSRGRYTSYLHTDRRLYLPGETVHIHAIIRENIASLDIPRDTPFTMTITDPLGKELKKGTYKTNDFGSLSLDLELEKDTTIGMYNVSISVPESTDFIEYSNTIFQVEVFKNPTFTANVELRSNDLESGSIKNLRKIKNTDPYTPWYSDIYSGNMTIEGIVRARYYNGSEMKNMPFTYRVYKSISYPSGYWGDCFWGCYYDPPLDLYTEGSGAIDSDGYGIIRIPVEYRSAYNDYTYTVEVTIRDGLSGESVTTPGSLLVRLPSEYKGIDTMNAITFTPKKKILSQTEPLMGKLKPQYGPWEPRMNNKYRYDIKRREYSESWIDDIRTGETRITTSRDISVMSGTLTSEDISLSLAGTTPGEYHISIFPDVSSPPEESTTETIFYVTGGPMTLRDSTLRVIPDRTIYRSGEKARVMVQVPFTGSYLLITKEKGGVIDREYTYLSGNILTRDYDVDDTMLPNAYIGVVALKPGSTKSGERSYAVGYAEIITDIADKKSLLTIKPEKEIYKNRETANIDLTLTDRSGAPLEGEVTLMVVDESLIRIIGNIDLDIIPKFYQKFPFTVKTALSAIGIERGQYLSRKGSSGGGGDKGGGGDVLSSRTLFENTAYYNPSILTDKNGRARASFTLPDNITDYRIIAIANTKDSTFSVAEKNISVRKDYVIESHMPMILYPGDTSTFNFEVFNTTNRITEAELLFTIGTGSGNILKKVPLALGASEKKGIDISITIPSNWSGEIPYTIELREKDKILDSLTHALEIKAPPVLSKGIVDIRIWTGTTLDYTIPPASLSGIDLSRSRVSISLSDSFLPEFDTGLDSLMTYPYGCIEQTISSTLPNRVALSVAEKFGLSLDRIQAEKNVSEGLAKILRMQHVSGGWMYWEGSADPDAHITPYVLRTLYAFRELGDTIPESALENARNYILSNESTYREQSDLLAEATWALALARDPAALRWWTSIDTQALTRHGYVAYISAASLLGKYTMLLEKEMISRLEIDRSATWYWNARTDRALFAQLLYARGDREKAIKILYPLIGKIDITSYYISTQEKIQYLLALIAESDTRTRVTAPESVAMRSSGLIADLSLSRASPTREIVSTRAKIGESYTLKRDISTPRILITRIHDLPTDITRLPSVSTGGIDITRTYELIDESAGIDRDGQYRKTSVVGDATFERGRLYRTRLTAQITTPSPDISWYHLAIEDFLPGGYRPINTTFTTESSLIENQRDENWWSYMESRDDRILAHLMYGYGNKREYTYYFRPERVGDYLLPPATAYFMYDPDRHAYTEFSRVKVLEKK